MDLNSLSSGTGGVSLDTLSTQEKTPVGSQADNDQHALFTAAATSSSDNLITNYQRYKYALENGDTTSLKQDMSPLQAKYQQDNLQTAAKVLTDPAVPDQVKYNVPQYLEAHQDLTARQAVVENMATAPNGVEGVNQENARMTIMSGVDDFLQYQRESHALVAGMQAANDQHGSTADMIVNMLPGMSGLITQGIKNDVLGQQTGKIGAVVGMMSSFRNTADIRNYIDTMTADKRLDTLRQVLTYANNGNAGLFDEANYASLNLARDLVDSNDTSNEGLVKDVLFDSLYLLGGGSSKAAKAAKVVPVEEAAPKFTETTVANAVSKYVRGDVDPSSMVQTASAINPNQGFHMLKMVEGGSDEVAKAITAGKSRDEALTDLMMPETTASDATRVKPHGLDYDDDLVAAGLRDSGFRYTQEELDKQAAGLQAKIDNAAGITMHSNMSKIVYDSGNGFNVSGLAMDGGTGFNNADAAMERTLFGLKDVGVSEDSLQLMQRTPEGYKPVDYVAGKMPLGDYAVQVNHNWGYNLKEGFSEMQPRFNVADSLKGLFDASQISRQGSLTQHVFSPTYIFPKVMTQPHIVAETRGAGLGARLIGVAREFESQVAKLPSREQKSLVDYIKRANQEGIAFDADALAAQGYSKDSINAYKTFKKFNDTSYILENADKVKTMDSLGYGYVVDRKNKGQLLAKPLPRNAPSGVTAYDPITDTFKTLTKEEKKELYDGNGFIAELRHHIDGEEGAVKHIIVNNTPENYFRNLNTMDRILSYRDGYYKVAHQSPFFIVQNVKDKSGRLLYSRAVGKAGTVNEAKTLGQSIADRTGAKFDMTRTDDSDFFVRTQHTRPGVTAVDDDFDLGMSAGRSAQRFRGAPLETVDTLAEGQSQYLLNPVEAMRNTAQSIGNRVAIRPVLETLKKRFIEQYGDFLPMEKGMKYIPSSPTELGKGAVSSRKLTDARTTWAYIKQLEDGFVSGLDGLSSTVISSIADGVGRFDNKVAQGTEKALRGAAAGKASTLIKGTVFVDTLGLNTIGSMITQGSQSVSNLLFNAGLVPIYSMTRDITAAVTRVGPKEYIARGESLLRELKSSGLLSAIDMNHSESIGGFSVSGMSGLQDVDPTRPIKSFLKVMQMGNNIGEGLNQSTAWLVKRAAWEQGHPGMIPTARQLDQITADAKSMTFNFSKAGSFAYQNNTLSVPMQFFQMMHKAVMDPFLSRTVGTRDRLAMMAAPMLIYGVPVNLRNAITSTADSIPGISREDKDKFATAMEMSILKHAFSTIGVKADDLYTAKYNPMDAMGMGSQLLELFHNGLPGLVSKSPAGTLVTSRLWPAVKTFGQYTGFIDRDSGTPVSDEALMKAIGGLSSGSSNLFKASQIYHTGELRNNNGDLIEGGMTKTHAIAMALGLPTEDYQRYLAYGDEKYTQTQDFQDDIKNFIKNVNSELINNGMMKDNPEYVKSVVNSVLGKYKDSPQAMQTITKVLEQDARKNGEASYLISTLRMSGMMSYNDMVSQARLIPDADQRQQTLDFIYKVENGNE